MFKGRNGSKLCQFLQNLQEKRLDWVSVLINASIESEGRDTRLATSRSIEETSEYVVFIQNRRRLEDGRESQDLGCYGSG